MSATKTPTHVVLLVHGIRDYGPWQAKVSSVLTTDDTVVVSCKFGFYSTLRFLAPWDMSGAPMKRVHREIKNAMRAYPGAKISVIAHSFGSDILTRILKDDHDIQLWRIILCGSVVKQDFRWDDVVNQIGEFDDPAKARYIVNDCGNADPWPVLGAAAGWRYGSAGTDGFGTAYVSDRFHKGGHGLFFDKEFIAKNWKPFIDGGYIVPGDAVQRDDVPRYIQWLGRLPLKFLIPLLLLLIIGMVGYGVARGYAKITSPPFTDVKFDDFTSRLETARASGAEAEHVLANEFSGKKVRWHGVLTYSDIGKKAYYVGSDMMQPENMQALVVLADSDQFDPTIIRGSQLTLEGVIQTINEFGIIINNARVLKVETKVD